jgi:hypothetical protein
MPVVPTTRTVEIQRIVTGGQQASTSKPGMVAYDCKHSYVGKRGRKITIKASPRQKCKALCEKQPKSKKDWLYVSSGTVMTSTKP